MSDEWQPIETAPKDGTLFLAFGPHDTMNVVSFAYTERGRDFWWTLGMPASDKVTHWMPLPPAPKTGREE